MVAEAPTLIGWERNGQEGMSQREGGSPRLGVLLEAQSCEGETRRNGTGPQTGQTTRLEGEQSGCKLCVAWAVVSSCHLRAGGVQIRGKVKSIAGGHAERRQQHRSVLFSSARTPPHCFRTMRTQP